MALEPTKGMVGERNRINLRVTRRCPSLPAVSLAQGPYPRPHPFGLTWLLWWALVTSSMRPTRSVVDTPWVRLHSLGQR